MKKFTIVLVSAILLSGCSLFSSTETTTPTPPPQPTVKTTSESGIKGTAMIGPTCPVERMPPDPDCADKPYTGELVISTGYDVFVKQIQVQADGTFSVNLDPGTYIFSLPEGKIFPTLSRVAVVVVEGVFTKTNLQLDSGIR